ncbi:MAG: hypothetical protein U0414_01885 [Polyangiaceae bacterium]
MTSSWIALGLLLGAAVVGCKAPEKTEASKEFTNVRLGDVAFRARLPVGAKLDQQVGASVRYEVPGRGGAVVVFALQSDLGDLDERSRAESERAGPDGARPVVTRSELRGGRLYLTTTAQSGKLVRVLVAVPLPAGSARPAMSCWANVTRSEPIADVEGTRDALETVCDSITFDE